MLDPNELVLCYEGFKTKVPTRKKVRDSLASFFEDHGLSPNDWFAWKGGVDIFEPQPYTWRAGREIFYSYLTGSFITTPTTTTPDDLITVRRRVAPNRTKYYIRAEDVEIWVPCPEEGVQISNRGRVRCREGNHLLKIRSGGKVSGPWVMSGGKTVYVRDLMRKYIYAIPGME